MRIDYVHGQQCRVGVVEHSLNQDTNTELITCELRYPRFIHAELMTHRVFSRNAASSRAIPNHKIVQSVTEDPAFFVHLGKNQAGMQSTDEEVDVATKSKFFDEWKELAQICADYSTRWSNEYHLHKQITNRVLEPFLYMSVIVSSTEWDNWFWLRDDDAAQPEIRDLARTMRKSFAKSRPRIVQPRTHLSDPRGWHLPYITMEERTHYPIDMLLGASSARNARVSYLNHSKEHPVIEKDLETYEKLISGTKLHASPLEHQAWAASSNTPCRNFRGGWVQHRAMYEVAGSTERFKDYLIQGHI